jgi:hypothetical protein
MPNAREMNGLGVEPGGHGRFGDRGGYLRSTAIVRRPAVPASVSSLVRVVDTARDHDAGGDVPAVTVA